MIDRPAIYEEIAKNLAKGVLIDKTWDLPKAHLLSNLYEKHLGDMIVITSHESGSLLFEDLSFFQKDLLDLPGWENFGSHGEKPSQDVMGRRLNI